MSEIIEAEDLEIAAVEPGDIVTISGARYRVLEMEAQRSTIIELDTSKINIGSFSTFILLSCAVSGEYKVEKYKEPSIVVDESDKKYKKRHALIMDISDKYAGDIIGFLNHHPKHYIESLMKKHEIRSLTTLLYIVRRYVQSGYSNKSLMPEKHKYPKGCDINIKSPKKDKNGRSAYILKPSDIPKMDDAIKQYKAQETAVTTLHLAYKYLEAKYYTDICINPATGKSTSRARKFGNKPSEDQFRHYYYNMTDALERKKIKERLEKIRNDNRNLSGGKDEDAIRPGTMWELDACELRVSLIGTYRPEYNVGIPTLYVMKDVYSKMIIAMSIGYGKNKTESLCKLFGNIVADKTKFCERYGIYGLTQEMWPSGAVLPQRIRCDRGPEFKAKETARICNALKIPKELVPGASGSLKGDVEQFFHQIQSDLDHFLKKHGLIEKDYFCKYKTEAVLNMLDIAKMCILYVIYYNNRIMEYFESDIEMEESKARLSPIGLWNYGNEKYGAPRQIQNKMQYLDTLLLQGNAKVNNSGIHFKDLIFYTEENQELAEKMFKAQKKRNPVKILYDPNTISYVKYITDSGEPIKVPLNTRYRKYKNLDGYTFPMWSSYIKFRDARKRLMKEEDADMETEYIETMKNIVSDAVAKRPTKVSDKNIKEARAYEECMDAPRESITFLQGEEENKRIADTPQSTVPVLDTNTEEKKVVKKPEHEPQPAGEYEYDPEEHYRELMRLT